MVFQREPKLTIVSSLLLIQGKSLQKVKQSEQRGGNHDKSSRDKANSRADVGRSLGGDSEEKLEHDNSENEEGNVLGAGVAHVSGSLSVAQGNNEGENCKEFGGKHVE